MMLQAYHCSHTGAAFTGVPQRLKEYEQSLVKGNKKFPCANNNKKINRSTTNLHDYAIDLSYANDLLLCLYNKFTAKTTLHIPYVFNLGLDC